MFLRKENVREFTRVLHGFFSPLMQVGATTSPRFVPGRSVSKSESVGRIAARARNRNQAFCADATNVLSCMS